MNKLKILELFGGIGACSKALERLGIDYEIADYVEIDKYAVKSFNAMHNTNFEPQDVCEWNKDIEVDLIMHGSPCQDFSLAGLQAGGDEGSGTRSSLMYETIRIVEKIKPKYVIWENVKNVISKKHKHNYDNYCNKMSELGYTNYGQVLNAKDYGIPQNRERVFTISIRKDLNQTFTFPAKQELKLRLKDMLEDNVDEKYYLSDKMIEYISATGTANFRNPDSKINLDIARPLTTDQNKRAGTTNYLCNELPDNYNLKIKNAYLRNFGSKGKLQNKDYVDTLTASMGTGGGNTPIIEIKQVGQLYGTEKEPNPQDGRIYDSDGLTPTLDTTHIPKMVINDVINPLKGKSGKSWQFEQQVYDDAGCTRAIKAGGGSGNIPKVVVKDNMEKDNMNDEIKIDIIGNYSPSNYDASRIVNNEGLAPTVKENHGTTTATNTNDLRIRKLTPKECWRLMGFDDEDFEKASKVNSNAQLYKQAGNSIVVNVLEGILKNLLGDKENE